MKITDVRTTVVGTPWRELTFVRLETDEGFVGVGEVRMVNKTETLLACIREMSARYVIGADPFDLELIAHGMQWSEYGRPGEVLQSALAAIDLACWDIIGKATRQPVWRLLGGAFRDKVPAYANGWYQDRRDPEAVGARAKAVVARGYRGLKLDPFGAAADELPASELDKAVAIVAAVREAVGRDVSIMIEMHGRFRGSVAARVAQEFEQFSPAWLEEPVPPTDLPGMRRVRAATSATIATGERAHSLSEIRELLEEGLVDVLQVDVTHFGGLTALRKAAAWAGAYNLPLAPHNVCGPVGTAANVHFGIATPNFLVLEHFNDFADQWVSGLVDHAPAVDPETGAFSRSDRPGLGVELDLEACAEHPATGVKFDLFTEGWEMRDGAVAAR